MTSNVASIAHPSLISVGGRPPLWPTTPGTRSPSLRRRRRLHDGREVAHARLGWSVDRRRHRAPLPAARRQAVCRPELIRSIAHRDAPVTGSRWRTSSASSRPGRGGGARRGEGRIARGEHRRTSGPWPKFSGNERPDTGSAPRVDGEPRSARARRQRGRMPVCAPRATLPGGGVRDRRRRPSGASEWASDRRRAESSEPSVLREGEYRIRSTSDSSRCSGRSRAQLTHRRQPGVVPTAIRSPSRAVGLENALPRRTERSAQLRPVIRPPMPYEVGCRRWPAPQARQLRDGRRDLSTGPAAVGWQVAAYGLRPSPSRRRWCRRRPGPGRRSRVPGNRRTATGRRGRDPFDPVADDAAEPRLRARSGIRASTSVAGDIDLTGRAGRARQRDGVGQSAR